MCCEQNVADIATPQQKNVGLLFRWETLRQAHGRSVANGLKVHPEVGVSRSQHSVGVFLLKFFQDVDDVVKYDEGR